MKQTEIATTIYKEFIEEKYYTDSIPLELKYLGNRCRAGAQLLEQNKPHASFPLFLKVAGEFLYEHERLTKAA